MNTSLRVLASLLAVGFVGADQFWSCAGPVTGAHGASRGDLVVGAFQVSSDYEWLEAGEEYDATEGESVTFELSGLATYNTFLGFLVTASGGDVYPASANAEADDCGVGSAGEAPETSAKVTWVAPSTPGTYSVTVYVLADEETWWASTYEYAIGEVEEEAGSSVVPSLLAAASAAVVLLA